MAWSDIFIRDGAASSSEQQAAYDKTQALFQQRLQQREAAGTITPSQVDYYQNNTGPLESQNSAAWQGFQSGLADSSSNVNGFFSGLIGQIFGAVPVSVWALAAVALFIYAGGGLWLKGRLAK